MTGGLGLMFDTTIALCRIILSGLMEKHPRLKLVCPHVGGALPYLVGRIDHQTMVLKRGADNIRRPPSEYLRRVWLDTVNPIGLAIKYAWEFAGADKLLYSSDHPWVDPQLIVDQVDSQKFPTADVQKLYSGNARALFQL
jgi:predicted TIM-barrel fold metal-dependent hydrolase